MCGFNSQNTRKMKSSISTLLAATIVVISTGNLNAQAKTDTPANEFTGISVSPSSLHFKTEPGNIKTMEVKVTNDTKSKYTFQASFNDFTMGLNGNPVGMKAGESEYGLSKWASINPSYFEVAPGETKKISITVTVPAGAEGMHAAWTVLMLDQVMERAPLSPNGTNNTVALGIAPSIGFGVYVYQNPPGIQADEISIQQFSIGTKDTHRILRMNATNKGQSIGFCTTYVEITNLSSGKQDKLRQQKFTILPGFQREFTYDLPASLPKGKYSAVSVVDTGNPEEITAAELEFSID